MAVYLKQEKGFLDLKVPMFMNKKNGQISLTLPKRELKKIINFDKDSDGNAVEIIPKQLSLRIFKWRKQ